MYTRSTTCASFLKVAFSTMIFSFAGSGLAWAAPNHVAVLEDDNGFKLQVDGEDFFVYGMNWGYMPIGENYSYPFWDKSDAFIKEALDTEMALLVDMGVNAIRQYDVIPPRWVEYIYETYGIYTIVNNLVGRYGASINGVWVPQIDYSDEATRSELRKQLMDSVEKYKDTPGVLMWILGNENNYGLHWDSFEIGQLPKDEQAAAKATFLYSLYGELTDAIHEVDPHHPVGLTNGDLQYIDILAEQCGQIDIMGSNVYRGISSRDLFDEVKEKLNVPFLYTEFGSDAYNAKTRQEDAEAQAMYLHGQWQEIYEHSYGKGRANNAIGGLIFQWSDGWWKHKQEINLDIHDTTASWPNAAYAFDFMDDRFNMNEEWFGIAAKGRNRSSGHYSVYPRTAYYVLQDAFKLDPYAPDTDIDKIRKHFGAIRVNSYRSLYQADKLALAVEDLQRVSLYTARLELSTFLVGGGTEGGGMTRPNFDHMQSAFAGIRLQPTNDLRAEMAFNLLGNVAQNPIDEIFYEKRGLPVEVVTADGDTEVLRGLERTKLYSAKIDWEHDWFKIEGYYRTGQYHWGDEGDFFGLFRETYYGPNLDIYDGEAPLSLQFEGRKKLKGLKVAAGPQIFWGANPGFFVKYTRNMGQWNFTLLHHEDVSQQGSANTSNVIPEQMTRQSTLHLQFARGGWTVDFGGIWAGTPKIGQEFTGVRPIEDGPSYIESGYAVVQDRIKMGDTFGAKGKVTLKKGIFQGYAQGAYQGLVADGGVDSVINLTGWTMRPSGRGNQFHAVGGAVFQIGTVQLAAQGMYQKPLEGPLPPINDYYDPNTDLYFPGTRARNVIDDPFAVLENRETLGGEIILAYDPTPITWFWQWDNEQREDATFAGAMNVTYRHQPTTRDARFGWNEFGQLIAFPGAPPAQDVWDVRVRTVTNPGKGVRLHNTFYGGTGQANGVDPRLVTRFGGDVRLRWKTVSMDTSVKVNDWGPYDYHRDYNLTFPLQIGANMSYGLNTPKLGVFNTQIGVRGKLRYLNAFSNRFDDAVLGPNGWGKEYEVMTYAHFTL